MPTPIVFYHDSLRMFSWQTKSNYEKLLDYEGKYEYSNPATLTIAASNYDTTLYAIIDDAQYPLKYINRDSFQTPQKTSVIFQRDENKQVISYIKMEKALNE